MGQQHGRPILRDEAAVWMIGLANGLRMLSRDPVLALKRLILPTSYWRTAEFGFVWNHFRGMSGGRLLDVGSPKDLACTLAVEKRFEVVSTDIRPEEVESVSRNARALGILGSGPGRISGQVEDARHLSFPDRSFDAAFSVSVIEHIPGLGDSEAVRELYRVVKPGGLIVITVPFDRAYRETFVDGPVYERDQIGREKLFFERHYDHATLEQRITAASPAQLISREIWGEGTVRGERILSRAGPFRTALSPLEPLLAMAALRPVESGSDTKPMAAFLAFEVPAA